MGEIHAMLNCEQDHLLILAHLRLRKLTLLLHESVNRPTFSNIIRVNLSRIK
jgi:hypothetical protein